MLVTENKTIYLNRTWEAYRYQSSMIACVYNLIEQEVESSKLNYKEVNNIKRMTKRHKDIFESILKLHTGLNELKQLEDSLK